VIAITRACDSAILPEQLGEEIAGALAMWLERIPPDQTPIIALGPTDIVVVVERTTERP